MNIVGICGYAGAGKDALASQLLANDGYERCSFADPMRRVLYAMNPIVGVDSYMGSVRVRELIDEHGWEKAKRTHPEIRQLLQRLGTEGGRDVLGDTIWVDTLFKLAKTGKLVIPDVRFPNEADAIRSKGGVLVRVVRDGVVATNQHVSESALQVQDIILHNNGTIEDLYEQYVYLVAQWKRNR